MRCSHSRRTGGQEFRSLEALAEWAENSLKDCLNALDYPDDIYLRDFERGEAASKGSGATALRALCDYADQIRKPIALHDLMGNDALVDYYRRFGFEISDPGDEPGDEPGDDIGMVRSPKS